MRPPGCVRLVLVTAALIGSAGIFRASGASDPQDVAAVVARVGERVAAYYQRAQRLICLERSTVMPIASDWSQGGFARTVESELRVELDALDAVDGAALPDARVTREIRRINGREPRDRDQTDRSGCTDPTPISPEPLAFLLPAQREAYAFTKVRPGREQNRTALIIDFESKKRSSHPELIEDEHGHDDCFDWKGPVATSGRLWVDAVTYDVLRLERHLAGLTDVRVPSPLQRKYRFTPWLTLERDDSTLRFKEVAFSDPDETVVLPESIESITVFRTGLQSMRRLQAFKDYRRFLTATHIK